MPHDIITLLLMLAATLQLIVIVDIDTKKTNIFFTKKKTMLSSLNIIVCIDDAGIDSTAMCYANLL